METFFNDGWLFSADGEAFYGVELPHDYQITLPRAETESGSQGFYPHDAVIWYKKVFFAPEAWAGKVVSLVFDGAQRFAAVSLNGEMICAHKYGYTPFAVHLAGLVIGAENELLVRLDNTDSGDRWYSGMGIYRNVRLLVTEPCRISPWGLNATHVMDGDDALLDVTVELNNAGAAREVEIEIAVCGEVAHISGVAAAGKSSFSMQIRVKAPGKWDVDAPRLHVLSAKVTERGALLDAREIKTGFRDARFDPDTGFWLNGRSLKLKGVNLHHDGGVFGAAVPEKIWRRRLLKLKEMGANAVRTSHNPQAPEFYDLCDALGLLVVDELYDKWAGSKLYFKDVFLTDRLSDLETMVARDRSHPSVILWSVGNEVEIQYREEYYAYLEALCARCCALDPTRPVSMALISYVLEGFDESEPLEARLDATLRYGEIVDVFMGNYMESFYMALRERGLKKAFLGSEILAYYRFEELSNTNLVPFSPWNDVEAHPWVAGGFYWAGIDYIGESTGWPCHGWTGCPIDSAGFFKPRSYHIMSQWKKEPMVKLAVFDDSQCWDMANGMWGFPETVADWNQDMPGRIYHVAAFTNCERVVLRQSGRFPRVAMPDPDEGIAHFYVPYAPGELVAEGYAGGEKVCGDRLVTASGPAKLELSLCDGLMPDGRDIAQIEARLLDAEGQVYTRARPELKVSVEGAAALWKLSNGDFLATDEIPRMHEGHMLIVLRANGRGGEVRVTASCEVAESATLTFRTVSPGFGK